MPAKTAEGEKKKSCYFHQYSTIKQMSIKLDKLNLVATVKW